MRFLAHTLCLAILFPAAGASRAQNPPPPDLAVVPADATLFIAARPAALLAGAVGRDLRRANRLTTFSLQELSAQAVMATGGIELEHLERVAFIVHGTKTVWLFTATQRLDPQQVLRTTGFAKAPPRALHGARLYAPEGADDFCIAFVGERSYLHGTRQDVEGVLAASHPPRDRPVGAFPPPLMETLQAADRNHLVAILRNPEAGAGPGIDPAEAIADKELAGVLKELAWVRVSARFDREFELEARAAFRTEKAARQARKLLEGQREAAQRHLDELGEVLAERFVPFGGPALAREVMGFYQAAGPALRDLRVEQSGLALQCKLTLPGRGAFWALGMLAAPVMRVTTSPVDTPADLLPAAKEELLRKGLPGSPPPD